MSVEVYVNFDGRYYLRHTLSGYIYNVYGDANQWWPSDYTHRIRYFWFKGSAIYKAKQLEKQFAKRERRRAFKDQKVWR